MTHYHLAQLNIARMIAPIDSPQMADFVANLAPVNQIAESSPGFVWRLQTPAGDATLIRAFDDPKIIVNMSVWESVDALRAFTYKTGHEPIFRRRTEWFEKMPQAHMVFWWIPAGHIPSVEEARDRLEFRRAHGDTPAAFSFGKSFPVPDVPAGDAAPSPISYDGRRFTIQANSPNGNCTPDTLFLYRQSGSRVWATYDGGPVRFGSLVAVTGASGGLDVRYHHVGEAGVFRTGEGSSRPEVLRDGRLRLHETWRWTNGDQSAGETVLEEVER